LSKVYGGENYRLTVWNFETNFAKKSNFAKFAIDVKDWQFCALRRILCNVSGHVTSALTPGAMRSIAITVSVRVCLSVCLSVCSHLKNYTSKLHEIFLYMLPVALAWSSFDDSVVVV